MTRKVAAASATRTGASALPAACRHERDRRMAAAVGERAVGVGQAEQRDVGDCRARATRRTSAALSGSARPSALRRSSSASVPTIAPTRTAGHVEARAERRARADESLPRMVVVLRQVQAAAGRDLRRRIVDQRRRRDQPLLEGQRVDERLQRRARLAPRAGRRRPAARPTGRRSSRPRRALRRSRCRGRRRRRPRRCGRRARRAGGAAASTAKRCRRASSGWPAAPRRRGSIARRAKWGASCSPSGMPRAPQQRRLGQAARSPTQSRRCSFSTPQARSATSAAFAFGLRTSAAAIAASCASRPLGRLRTASARAPSMPTISPR